MKTFIFGEAMLEYHSHGGAGLRYGGDTLNTAIHLARAGHDVAYVTAIGNDPISDALEAAWSAEGIDTRYVLRHPERHPGIYAIHVDERGERSFLYWRDQSAARQMFELPGINSALSEAQSAKLVYFSLISLAIISAEGCEQLLRLSSQRKADGKAVAYDSNYRQALWQDESFARALSERAMAAASIGLPTNTDERELWGTNEGESEIARRWLSSKQAVVAVKAAERGCVLGMSDGEAPQIIPAQAAELVDSSGAGDAFNAGFLSGWLDSRPLIECVETGQSLARKTLSHQGAIML